MSVDLSLTLHNIYVSLNLDPAFIALCQNLNKQSRSPPSPTDTLVSPTATDSGKIPEEEISRLTDYYPYAYSDFKGHGTPCIYKTGDAWPIRTGPEALQGTERDPRPIHRHPITSQWLSVLTRITEALDKLKVQLTSIDPLAYAHPGEAAPFCDFVISIGVQPHSLVYSAAVAAGEAVQNILVDVGYPTIQIAFIESVYRRAGAGSKLLEFNPLLDDLPELRKPFTSTLGIPIAPLNHTNYEGTGGLYFRLSKDDNRVAILTCAHVAHPPPVHRNTSTTLKKNTGQPREEIIALGNKAYNTAIKAIMGLIGELADSIEVWNDALERLGDEVDGERESITKKRQAYKSEIEKATEKIKQANALHDEVTKHYSIPEQRVIGFVLHWEKIEVSVQPHGYTKDWALIELYPQVIDWPNFKGNMIYIGGNMTSTDFRNTMFPQESDRKHYKYPRDGLLQVKGIVPEKEFRDPQDLDMHGMKTLLCTKHGRTTKGTFGRVNGLESLTRIYKEYGIHEDSIEVAVLGYDVQTLKYRRFSDEGDSGAAVVGRDGRLIGLLTGGSGPTEETDKTYISPYFWLNEQIKAKFPDCFLYDLVN